MANQSEMRPEIQKATPQTRLAELLQREDLVPGLRLDLMELSERASTLSPQRLTEEIDTILRQYHKEMSRKQAPKPPLHNPIRH